MTDDKSKFEEYCLDNYDIYSKFECWQASRISLLSDLQSEGMVEETASSIWSAYGSVPFSKVDTRCRAKFISLAQAALTAITNKLRGNV